MTGATGQEGARGGPWRHPLVKRGTVKPVMGETTPFVFRGRLYRLENWQKFMELPRATCGERFMEDVVRIWDVEADRLVSVALAGHSFGMAFVWNDRVHLYAAAHPANSTWRTVTEITRTTSDDLLHWSPPEVVLRAEPGEHLFNVAVCRGRDRFVLLYETDDRRWPAFTFKYCESDDLRRWTRIPDALYGTEKYVGGPALYYEGGRYYTLYLQDLRGSWETRVTRSDDLVHWEDAPAGRSCRSTGRASSSIGTTASGAPSMKSTRPTRSCASGGARRSSISTAATSKAPATCNSPSSTVPRPRCWSRSMTSRR